VNNKTLKESYYRLKFKKAVFIISGIFVLIALALAAVSLGAASLSMKEISRAVIAKIVPFLEIESSHLASAIVWDLRLPRIAMAIIAGMGFGISGATMQGILRNPLVSPFTLGVSAAAGFGAALAIVIGAGIVHGGQLLIVSNAFIFALIAVMLVFFLSRLRGISSETIILSGIAVMYLFSAMTSFLQYTATAEQLSNVVFWLLGSLAATSWINVFIVLCVVMIALPFLIRYSWDINAISVGDETAITLGANIKMVRIVSMIFSTLIAASIICFTGVIGFIGLVAPHITRMIIGSDYRFLLPASGLVGALLLLGSDTLARTVFMPSELPLGVMTAFIGVPFFVYILITRRRQYF
jgi:iron complex transport system permease protein